MRDLRFLCLDLSRESAVISNDILQEGLALSDKNHGLGKV